MERNTTHLLLIRMNFAKLGNVGSVFYDPETTILEEVVFNV